jgi:hypothetical protein
MGFGMIEVAQTELMQKPVSERIYPPATSSFCAGLAMWLPSFQIG